jgi:hypothetical protein
MKTRQLRGTVQSYTTMRIYLYLPPISHSSTNHDATSAAIRKMIFPIFFQPLPASGFPILPAHCMMPS